MIIEPDYQATLDELYRYIDFSLSRMQRATADHFDLGRMHELLARLGDPHKAYPVIHVAGTKGKGSVSALCASALQAAGYRTGLYTSPHLIDFVERMRVDGTPISHAAFVDLFARIRPHVEAIPRLTTFEIATAMAFWHFAERGCTAAVIEVGLGGRLDASNVVDPTVAVITSLSYDHAEILGDTLAKIAGEKAGIIKPGRPLVLAPQVEEARHVVVQTAAERNAPLVQIGRDWLYAAQARSLIGQTLLVWPRDDQQHIDAFIESGGMEDWEPRRLSIPLLGQHQVENAATAYAALQLFRQAGHPLSEAAIRSGFERVQWAGRFQILRREPPLVIDSAHNRDSALRLRQALDDYFPGLPVVMVFGASEDKDIPGMFAELLPRIRQVVTTASLHPRAADVEKLAQLAHTFGKQALAVNPLEDALRTALRLAGKEAVVLVTGSIFVAAATLEIWENQIIGIAENKA